MVTETHIPKDYGLFPRCGSMFRSFLDGERGASLMRDAGHYYRLNAIKDNQDEDDPYMKGGKITYQILDTIPAPVEPLDIFAANALVKAEPDDKVKDEYLSYPESCGLLGHLGHINLNYSRVIKRASKVC